MEARPRSTTSTPWTVTPSAKAAASSTPDRPHVAGDEDLRHAPSSSSGEAGEGGTDRPAYGGVELVGHGAADVVGLEDRRRGGLAGMASMACQSRPRCYRVTPALRRRGSYRPEPDQRRTRTRSRTRRTASARQPDGAVRRRSRRVTGTSTQRQPVALDQVEHLDVEGEAVDAGLCRRRGGPRRTGSLQAALRVAVLAEQDGVGAAG